MQRLLELARPTAAAAAAAAVHDSSGSSSSAVEYDTGASHSDVFDSDDVWRAQVHSLNVLRLVFIDSALAADVAQYISAALMVRSLPARSIYCLILMVYQVVLAIGYTLPA